MLRLRLSGGPKPPITEVVREVPQGCGRRGDSAGSRPGDRRRTGSPLEGVVGGFRLSRTVASLS